ncbi:MAG: DUF2807 domain-containing protein [Marinilabiliaceae bacterium]|nr:DUF2807 domain-containing protein [Marinilabiliaceae bacterium]
MKANLILLLMGMMMMPLMAQQPANPNAKVDTRTMGPYDKVKAGKGINVTLVESNKEEIVIHILNAEPEDVITQLEGKTLVLKMKTMMKTGVAVTAYVHYKKITELHAGGGASIDADGTVTADKLTLSVGADASIELDVDVKKLEASLTAGRIQLIGEAQAQHVVANTAARYNADGLTSQEAFVKVNTGAQATVNVSERISATAGGGGRIYYMGNPAKVEKTESFGGKVEPQE